MTERPTAGPWEALQEIRDILRQPITRMTLCQDRLNRIAAIVDHIFPLEPVTGTDPRD